jgi:hypothetical protein
MGNCSTTSACWSQAGPSCCQAAVGVLKACCILHAVVQNPFGDAKPREAVLASRTGKSEAEILVEEVKSEKPKVRQQQYRASSSNSSMRAQQQQQWQQQHVPTATAVAAAAAAASAQLMACLFPLACMVPVQLWEWDPTTAGPDGTAVHITSPHHHCHSPVWLALCLVCFVPVLRATIRPCTQSSQYAIKQQHLLC